MAFGVYIHIPYCLQICPYCDFTKYEWNKIMPPERYASLLASEIHRRTEDVPARKLDTVYFGGGTPSLFEPELILSILGELEKAGFSRSDDTELTIEIDPATVDQNRLDAYLTMGVNRFSVGAQTFNERLLKVAGRKHSAQDTVKLLKLLSQRGVNYSFDLLFALPTQTLEELKLDVVTALSFDPSHLSAYCLTVPENHPMSKGRAPEGEQTDMFETIETTLAKAGINRYEISNFARPGRESKHNMLYWTDQHYWGLGTGAHSYLPGLGPWGTRFWNAPSLNLYEKQILQDEKSTAPWRFSQSMPESQIEHLEKHQSLTDFCHTSLRLTKGLDRNALRLKFGEKTLAKVSPVFDSLETMGLISRTHAGWTMTSRGRLVANSVFEKLTFLEGELD
jgi:oxygen-independent coproporphyrinogen III oxidase